MRDKVTDLQADIAIQKAISQDLKEENQTTKNQNKGFKEMVEFQKLKAKVYKKMVRDANMKNGFDIPLETQQWRLMHWIDSQTFEDVKRDNYSKGVQEAARELYGKQQQIQDDPYLLYEVNKIERVCSRKYQLQQKQPKQEIRVEPYK